MKNILLIAFTSTLLLGCSTTNSMSLKEKNVAYSKYVIDESLPSKDKIRGFRFSDWKPLSDDYLIITTLRENYLVETKGRCSGLSNAHNIQLHRSSNLSLHALADSITPLGRGAVPASFTPLGGKSKFPSPLGGNSSFSTPFGGCLIESIYPITNVQTDYIANIGKQDKGLY